MIKSELIQKIANANPHLFHRDIEKIVNVLFDEIVGAMARGDRVELRGFGAFTVKHRAPRTGRNPRTGATVSVGEKFVPFFKTGKELRERLNDKPVTGMCCQQRSGTPMRATTNDARCFSLFAASQATDVQQDRSSYICACAAS